MIKRSSHAWPSCVPSLLCSALRAHLVASALRAQAAACGACAVQCGSWWWELHVGQLQPSRLHPQKIISSPPLVQQTITACRCWSRRHPLQAPTRLQSRHSNQIRPRHLQPSTKSWLEYCAYNIISGLHMEAAHWYRGCTVIEDCIIEDVCL